MTKYNRIFCKYKLLFSSDGQTEKLLDFLFYFISCINLSKLIYLIWRKFEQLCYGEYGNTIQEQEQILNHAWEDKRPHKGKKQYNINEWGTGEGNNWKGQID